MDAHVTDACPAAETLAAFAAGRLADDDLTRVAAHLENCPACLKAVSEPDPFTQSLQRIHQDGVTAWSVRGAPAAPDAPDEADDGPYFFSAGHAPPTKDPDQFFDALARSGLFDADDMKDVRRAWKAFRSTDVAAFAQTLALEQRLTEFHVRQLLRGKTRGWILNEYVVLHPLSAGGMGWIYRAHHRPSHRTYALKVTPPHLARATSAVKRFRREIEAVARLRHPRLVTAVDAGEADGINYLVMEEMPGHSLAEWVELNGPMRVLTAVDMIRQAAEGIAAAHDAGVIHRDIKPSNLWVEVFSGAKRASAGGPGVKVLDFGQARMTAALSSQRQPQPGQPVVIGSVGYIAPEQVRGDADQRSDIFSLGCTLYFLLTGKPPYQSLPASESVSIPPLESPREPIPGALQTIYRRMLAPSPADRYPSVGALINDLDAFLAGATIAPRLPMRLGKAALGAAAVVLIASLWLIFQWFRPGPLKTGPDGVITVHGPLPAVIDGPASRETVVNAQKAWAAALGAPVEITNSLGMKFRLIPPGTMPLGTPDGQIDERLAQLVPGADDWRWLRTNGVLEWPRQRVTLTKPFYLGTAEVTVGQFRAFVDKTKHQTLAETDGLGVSYSKGLVRRQSPGLTWRTPGYTHQTDNYPVVQIAHADAEAFCRWLAERERRPYSLPTEAQWEFACRAGRADRWFWGNDPDGFRDFTFGPTDGWYGPRAVALKNPNPFGLFDMSGNVAEWCADWFAAAGADAGPDPRGPANGTIHTIRGGAFLHPVPDGIASATRLDPPDPCQDFVGFRVTIPIDIRQR
jgi:formylglycine-generating enzyme required for sulfatase activity